MSAKRAGSFWAPEAPLGGLTLGDTLSLSVELVLERVGSLEAVPELMAVASVAVM